MTRRLLRLAVTQSRLPPPTRSYARVTYGNWSELAFPLQASPVDPACASRLGQKTGPVERPGLRA